VVTESVFSMDGDVAPLARYAAICREHNAVLIVDEAHAVGVYGRRGSGMVEETGTEDGVFVTVNTAGKALGVTGAFVSGPRWAIDYLIQRARSFIFSTAPPPAVAAALDSALTIVESEPDRRERVIRLAALTRKLLNDAGIDTARSSSAIIPIVIGDNERTCNAAAQLQREGFDVRPIRSPTVPAGTARLRVSVNAQLDEPTLRRFASAAAGILTRLGSCPAVCS
jgi:8-amino-7-oxononanoate synthase